MAATTTKAIGMPRPAGNERPIGMLPAIAVSGAAAETTRNTTMPVDRSRSCPTGRPSVRRRLRSPPCCSSQRSAIGAAASSIRRQRAGSRPEESLHGDVAKGVSRPHPSRPSASGRDPRRRAQLWFRPGYHNSIIDRIEYRAMIDYASRIRTGGHANGGESRIGDPSAGPDVAPKRPAAKA